MKRKDTTTVRTQATQRRNVEVLWRHFTVSILSTRSVTVSSNSAPSPSTQPELFFIAATISSAANRLHAALDLTWLLNSRQPCHNTGSFRAYGIMCSLATPCFFLYECSEITKTRESTSALVSTTRNRLGNRRERNRSLRMDSTSRSRRNERNRNRPTSPTPRRQPEHPRPRQRNDAPSSQRRARKQRNPKNPSGMRYDRRFSARRRRK